MFEFIAGLRRPKKTPTVPVTPPPPLLVLSTSSVAFVWTVGDAGDAIQTVTITNGASGSFAGLALANETEQSGPTGWLDTAISGTTVTITAHRTLFGVAGDFSGSVQVTDANASNSPRTIAITVAVASASVGDKPTQLFATRLLAGTGTTLVTSGVQCVPGAVMPADLDTLILRTLGGVEIGIYVAALTATYTGGSVRAFKLEYERTLTDGTPEELVLAWGVTPGVARRPHSGTSYANPAGGNYKLAHPPGISNQPKVYLARCRGWLPMDLRYDGQPGAGPRDATYFADYATWANAHWTGSDWGNNQYDRGFAAFTLWLQTGNAEYFRRACAVSVRFREERKADPQYPYVMSSTAWETQGWYAHYLCTGDAESRTAVIGAASLETVHHGMPRAKGDIEEYNAEARPWSRRLINIGLAKLLGDTSRDWQQLGTDSISADFTGVDVFGGGLPAGRLGWVATGVNTGAFWNQISICGTAAETVSHFMLSMKVYGLWWWYRMINANPTIPAKVDGALTYLTTQYRNGDVTPSLEYYNNSACQANGGPAPTVDLNGIHAAAYACGFNLLGTAAYKTRAEALFESLTNAEKSGDPNGITQVVGPFNSSGKVVNEVYGNSWLVPALR